MASKREEKLNSGVQQEDGHMREECSEKNLEGSRNFRAFNVEIGNTDEDIKEKAEKGVDNIADLLPNDPFNMDISATVTAITGWIGDWDKDMALKSLGFIEVDDVEAEKVDDQLFAEWNFVWNSPFRFHPESGEFDKKSNKATIELEHGLCDGHLLLDGDVEEIIGFSYEKYLISGDEASEHESSPEEYRDGEAGTPADALFFALFYLDVQDLLSVERVCKSLRDAVQNDPLMWRNIHINHPLNSKITDDALLRLTNRAQGKLKSLSLLLCSNITDSGLQHVLERNPCLTQLNVGGCIRLSIDAILCNLKVFKSKGLPGIKTLRIGGIFGVTKQHFEELNHLLGSENQKQLIGNKPRFYGAGQLYLSFDDERAIDIETCPRCQELRQVYDCPVESCEGKKQTSQLCRACLLCIARCMNCGRCLSNCDYEETFCLDLLCLDCVNQIFAFEESSGRISISSNQTLHQHASYHFYLCG